jgi:hypothetical protein
MDYREISNRDQRPVLLQLQLPGRRHCAGLPSYVCDMVGGYGLSPRRAVEQRKGV